MARRIVCPDCSTKLKAAESAFGKSVKCPRCGASFVIGGDAGAAGPASSAGPVPTSTPAVPARSKWLPIGLGVGLLLVGLSLAGLSLAGLVIAFTLLPNADPAADFPAQAKAPQEQVEQPPGPAETSRFQAKEPEMPDVPREPVKEPAAPANQPQEKGNDKPAAPNRGDPAARKAYRELAQALSQDYLLGGVDVSPELTKLTLERLSKAGSEEVRRGATRMLQGMNAINHVIRSVQASDNPSLRKVQMTRELTRKGDGQLVPFVVALIGVQGLPKFPELEKAKRRLALDYYRPRAWDEALPVADKFAGPAAKQPLVRIEFLADGPGGKKISADQVRPDDALKGRSTFLGRYVARNVAPHDLHHVTLAVDLHHYSTLPDATLQHVYFIPHWKKGEMLELSRNFLPDSKRVGERYNVVALERRSDGAPNPVASELQMMAGIVRMQAAVWCDESRQPPTRVDLPERSRIVAARLVKLAEDWLIEHAKFRNPAGIQFMLKRILDPVPTFMPADDPLTKQARRLIDDTAAARAEVVKRKENAALAACAEGNYYVGNFWARGDNGPFGLLFLSCDAEGKKIYAEVFYPDKPGEARLVTGFIAKDRQTQKDMIMLQPVFPAKGAPAGKRRVNVLDPKFKSYRFRLGDDRVLGEASTFDLTETGYDRDRAGITLKEAEADPRMLAEAMKRYQAAMPRKP